MQHKQVQFWASPPSTHPRILEIDAILGAIKIEYENIEFENGEIEKQSGELKANLT